MKAKMYEGIHQPLFKTWNNYKSNPEGSEVLILLFIWANRKSIFYIIKRCFKKHLFVCLMAHFAVSAFVTTQ